MQFSNKFFILPSAFGGIGLIYILVQGLLEIKFFEKIINVLKYIGKHTMPILLFHTIAFQIVTIFQKYILNISSLEMTTSWCHIYNEGYWAFIIGICGIVIPLFFSKGFNKSLLVY